MGDRRVPDYGLHGVLRVVLCGINGTRDLVGQLTGQAPATMARTMLQPILDEVRLAARTCGGASLNNEKANSKGKVRMCCAAAIHFVWNRGWEKVFDACLQRSASSSREKLGVGVQDVVGEFCKHVCVRLAFLMVPTWGGSGDIA